MNNPLLARFDSKPFLVSPEMQGVFESCLHQAANHLAKIEASTDKPKMLEGDDFWYADDDWRASYRPYKVKDGILQIPIKGVLLHDFSYQVGSWATGYDYIWRAYQRGVEDGAVKGIALICDTPGGEVAGNFDLVDKMFAMRGKKPVRGYAMESAYSAGYSIISVSDPGQITVSRTGGVGSIGVVTAHVDASGAMDQYGYKITFIHFGKHKVDGNPYQALPEDVKARIQTRIDELGEIFVSTVARNRGMDAKAIRETEALCYTASEAVSNGLADSIGSFEDAIAAFAADLSLEEEDETMTKENGAAEQAAIDTARAEGHAAGLTEGASTERKRITAILGSDEGKKRPVMAAKMATGDKFAALDSDTVIEMLTEMPEEKAEAAPNGDKPKGKEGASADFNAQMDKSKHPQVGADAPEMTEEATKAQARSSRLKAAVAAAGRTKPAAQ